MVPEPIEDEAFCNGDVAKISPNSARSFEAAGTNVSDVI